MDRLSLISHFGSQHDIAQDKLMKTKTLILNLSALSIMASLTEAATLRYRASGNWSAITDGASPGWGPNPNGVGTSLPGAADDARINFGNNTVTVDSAVPEVSRVQIGVDESGTVLVADGGVLTSGLDILAGNNNPAATGTLTVQSGGEVNVGRILWAANNGSDGVINIESGGVVNVANHLWLGVTGTANITISGTLNQTGGILGLGTSDASSASGGTATVSIGDGGLFALNNISGAVGLPWIQAGSIIDLTGSGRLTVNNDQVGTLNDYIDADKITGDGLAGGVNLNVSFDSDANLTTGSVIPEPSSVLLGSLALCLGLFVRRKS